MTTSGSFPLRGSATFSTTYADLSCINGWLFPFCSLSSFSSSSAVCVYVYMYAYICLYVCMYVCMHIRTYIHTHTYIHDKVCGVGVSTGSASCQVAFRHHLCHLLQCMRVCMYKCVYIYLCTAATASTTHMGTYPYRRTQLHICKQYKYTYKLTSVFMPCNSHCLSETVGTHAGMRAHVKKNRQFSSWQGQLQKKENTPVDLLETANASPTHTGTATSVRFPACRIHVYISTHTCLHAWIGTWMCMQTYHSHTLTHTYRRASRNCPVHVISANCWLGSGKKYMEGEACDMIVMCNGNVRHMWLHHSFGKIAKKQSA